VEPRGAIREANYRVTGHFDVLWYVCTLVDNGAKEIGMIQRSAIIAFMCIAVIAAVAAKSGQQGEKAAGTPPGWQLPPDADTKKSPLTVDEQVLAMGKTVFKDKCQKCHGPAGLGDGPDADPDHREDMDLTNPKRAERNSEGVMFYKVWNGRRRPKMPAFKEELTEQQVWSVVAYAQTLRKPAK
jgi:mono/diheme cytochrome c family protein